MSRFSLFSVECPATKTLSVPFITSPDRLFTADASVLHLLNTLEPCFEPHRIGSSPAQSSVFLPAFPALVTQLPFTLASGWHTSCMAKKIPRKNITLIIKNYDFLIRFPYSVSPPPAALL
jgi:hypothetical protein